MKKSLLQLLVLAAVATSCADQYMVQGTSNVEELEGKMLYLKVFRNDDMHAIDSARVVHGKFKFSGVMDSTMMANVFYEDHSVMPLVLEDGDVSLKIDENSQTSTGTPLNDSLSHFIHQKAQLDARMDELPHLESQMVMDGMDHDLVMIKLGEQAKQLEAEDDELVTGFIKKNYNNVLGPGIFMILTSSFPYPILNPQIEDIVTQATPYFLSHPYVREYMRAAEANMERMRHY